MAKKITGIPVKVIGDKFKSIELNEIVAVVNDNANTLDAAGGGFIARVAPSFSFAGKEKGIYKVNAIGTYGTTGTGQVVVDDITSKSWSLYWNGATLSGDFIAIDTSSLVTKPELEKSSAISLKKNEILSLGTSPTFGPNLVTGFVTNNQFTTSKTTFIPFSGGGRSNWFAVTEGASYQIQTLNTSLANSNWGKLFNSSGNTVYSLSSGDATLIDGSQVITIPIGLGIVDIGLNISTADQSGFVFRQITSGLVIKDSSISNSITRNSDIINQTNDSGEPNNQYTGIQTGIWDTNTAVGTPAVINSTSNYNAWRAGVLFPVTGGQTWLIRNRNDIGGSFGVFYDSSNNKVQNALSALLVLVGDHAWTFTVPSGLGITKIGVHTNNASPYPSSGVSVTRPATEIGKLKSTLLPTQDSAEKKNLFGVWNACGTSITFYDGTTYASGPQAGQITKGYQTWVKQEINFPDGVRNYGLGGHSWAVNSTNENTIVLKMAAWEAAKWWTAEGATNDFKLNVVIGSPTDYLNNTGANTLYGAMRLFVDKVYSLQSDSIIIFITDPHRNNDSYTSYSVNTLGKTLEDYHDVFRWVADRNGSPLCDTFRNSGINDNNLSQYTRDGLHPIDSGYKLMAREIITVFKDL